VRIITIFFALVGFNDVVAIERVISPGAQWPEWVTSVPLLFFSAIACDISRVDLEVVDVIIIVGMALTIVGGFILNLTWIPLHIHCGVLALSCLAVLSVVLWVIFSEKQLEDQIHRSKSLTVDNTLFCTELTPRERLLRVEMQFKRLQYAMKKVLIFHYHLFLLRSS
jgi:hypothetical protein